MIETPGGVPEWLNGAVSKTVDGGNVVREFESLPLRCAKHLEIGVAFGARLNEQFRERLDELLDELGPA